MISASLPSPRTLRLLLISLAVHTGIFFGLWEVVSTHPAILSALEPGERSQSHLLIEDVGPESVPGTTSKPVTPAPNAPSVDGPSSSTNASTSKPTQGASGPLTIGTADPYYSQVRSQVQSHVRYTPALARRRLQGQVQVALALSANGSVSSLNVLKSSGSTELDQLALESVQKAAPFPIFQSANPTRKLELPIDFRLR
jgi:TonB family protein